MRCQFTSGDFHSVANAEISLVTVVEPHDGQAGAGAVDEGKYSSKRSEHRSQRYS